MGYMRRNIKALATNELYVCGFASRRCIYLDWLQNDSASSVNIDKSV